MRIRTDEGDDRGGLSLQAGQAGPVSNPVSGLSESMCCPTGHSANRHHVPREEGASIAMAIVARTHPFVIGADTHARNHALAILALPNGEVIDDAQFPTAAAGLPRAVSWAGRCTGGDLNVLGVIDGVGTHGARLAVPPSPPDTPWWRRRA